MALMGLWATTAHEGEDLVQKWAVIQPRPIQSFHQNLNFEQ